MCFLCFQHQTRQNPRTRMQKRKLQENCNTATLVTVLSAMVHLATLATVLSATFSYSSYSTLSYSTLSPAAAIQSSSFATSQIVTPATQLPNASAQSAAPATRKRHASIDTLLKYCACHAKRKGNLNACHKTQKTRYIFARKSTSSTSS